MGGWWIAEYWNTPSLGPVWVVSWIVWIVVSITLHELAHGWAAIKLGDSTPLDLERMTFNPLVHMGPLSLLMLLFVGIAWGQMPVDSSRLRGRRADSLVALAGPGMNLLLVLIAGLGAVLWIGFAGNMAEPLRGNLAMFLILGAGLNLALAAFNLAPLPPLDGSRVVADFFPSYGRFFETENGRWVGLGLFLLVFLLIGRVIITACLLAAIAGVLLVGGGLGALTGMGIPLDSVLPGF